MKSRIVILIALFIVSFTNAFSQRIIRGAVTDESQQAIKGAIVNTNVENSGVRTNENGFYEIAITTNVDSIIFSFPGMETNFQKIDQRHTINVVLEPLPVEKEYHETVFVKAVGMAQTSKSRKQKVDLHRVMHVAPSHCHISVPEINSENYAIIHENGFRDVTLNPLSTFSADVDNASYSNIRRFLNNGELPPKDAVRVEEMINYFNYNISEPTGKHPIHVETEYTTCPWNESNGLLMIAVQAKNIKMNDFPPSNLVFLIDVSGSMQAQNKLPLVKSSLKMLVKNMRSEDKIAIVTYAGNANVALQATSGSNKEEITQVIDKLQAGGSTAGGKGLEMAYKIASENFITDGNNRIIMATDGDFNMGQSSDAEMERLIEKQRDNGVFMTVLGFGMGNYKDSKLELIANKGNGNYAYIDNSLEANKVLNSEFGGTLFTVAKDVKFQVEFNPRHVKSFRLIGYENRVLNEEDFTNDQKDAGEIGSGHQVISLYEIVPNDGNKAEQKLKYQKSNLKTDTHKKSELLTVKVRYKHLEENHSMEMEHIQPNKMVDLDEASENIRFAASVAQFGMLLRDSEFKGTSSIQSTTALAKKAKNIDNDGYRGEFIRLIQTAESFEISTQR